MAFEADHNRAALSQECAIVLRRTDFDSLGWLTVRCRSVVAGRVARWLAGCPNAPAPYAACFSSGESWMPGAEQSGTMNWLRLKPSLFVTEDQRKTLASQRVSGSSDRQLIFLFWPKEFQI